MREVAEQAPELTTDMLFVFAVLVVVFIGFLRSERSPDVIAMLGASALLVGGALSVDDLLGVFSNPGPVTVAALFVVSGALQRTGLVDRLGVGAGHLGRLGPLRARLLMLALVMGISGFINNTPVVMVLTPLVISLAGKLHTVPSKLLIPLSYASILGGACTIIGTSTNLIIDGVARSRGLEPFGIFEITAPGLIIGAVGLAYLILVAPWLLPERRLTFSADDVRARRDFVTELFVVDGSELAGKLLAETELFGRDDIVVVDVMRGRRPLRPRADLVLEPGDRVTIQSNATNVLELRDMVASSWSESEITRDEAALLAGFWPLVHGPSRVMEGIVGPGSRLVGEQVGALNLRQAYGVRVLALHRQGETLSEFEGERLRFGDILLLESREQRLRDLFAQQDLINLSEPAAGMFRRGHAPLALASAAAIVILAAFGVMPIAGLAVLGAVVLVGLRCIEPQEAYQAIDWRIMFLIFGMLAIGRAMQTSGAAAFLVDNMAGVAAMFGPWMVLAAIYVVASMLTEMITNNAVAVVLTPLAIGLAEQMGVDPRAFVVTIMFAASASFATPLGYQTNTIVYGAGNYHFRDFLRVGLPLNVIVGAVAVLVIPYFWPF